MKKTIIFLVSLLFLSIVCEAQSVGISTSRSNIRRGVTAHYEGGKLSLSFDTKKMTADDNKSYVSGRFILEADIVLTDAECTALKAPKGTIIKAGTYTITTVGTKAVARDVATGQSSGKRQH